MATFERSYGHCQLATLILRKIIYLLSASPAASLWTALLETFPADTVLVCKVKTLKAIFPDNVMTFTGVCYIALAYKVA